MDRPSRNALEAISAVWREGYGELQLFHLIMLNKKGQKLRSPILPSLHLLHVPPSKDYSSIPNPTWCQSWFQCWSLAKDCQVQDPRPRRCQIRCILMQYPLGPLKEHCRLKIGKPFSLPRGSRDDVPERLGGISIPDCHLFSLAKQAWDILKNHGWPSASIGSYSTVREAETMRPGGQIEGLRSCWILVEPRIPNRVWDRFADLSTAS